MVFRQFQTVHIVLRTELSRDNYPRLYQDNQMRKKQTNKTNKSEWVD